MSNNMQEIIKNPFVVLVIAIAVIGIGYSALGSGQTSDGQNDESASGVLTVSEESWDLGEISMADGDSVYTVELRNDSDLAVTITELYTSCMCTTAQLIYEDGSKSRVKGMPGHSGITRVSEVIEPGATALLEIIFDPNAHGQDATGIISRSVYLETDSVTQPEIELQFFGNVTK
ncbi:MAG: DUF1573 domain-containing protein [Candidatus Uhrbacteria bacterium]|nr:DUF1573 domain-containing protein [Candidatus Uhrbacteria bacterium]